MSQARARRPSLFQPVGEDVTSEQTIFDVIAQQDKTQLHTFLEKKPDLQAKNSDGLTALHVALRENFPVVTQLIEAKADIEAKTDQGDTPLLMAAEYFCYLQTAFQQLLAAGANPFVENFAGRTIHYFALRNHESELFKHVVELKIPHKLPDQDGDTVLHVLAAGDATEMSELKETAILIRKKFIAEKMREADAKDFFVTNKFGETPLHLAAEAVNHWSLAVMLEVMQEKLSREQMQQILSMQTLHGDTALHYAVRNLQCNVVLDLLAQAFLQFQVKPDIANKEGAIPCVELIESATLLCLLQQERLRAAELLKQAGADTTEPLRLAHLYGLTGFVVVLSGGCVEEASAKLQAEVVAGSPVTPLFAATLPALPMENMDRVLLDLKQHTPRGKNLRNECHDAAKKHARSSQARIQAVNLAVTSPRSPFWALGVVQRPLRESDAEDTCCSLLKHACVIL